MSHWAVCIGGELKFVKLCAVAEVALKPSLIGSCYAMSTHFLKYAHMIKAIKSLAEVQEETQEQLSQLFWKGCY